MVSLSRLLAAADDAPLDERAVTTPVSRPPIDCVLPPSLPSSAVPSRLRLALSLQTCDQSNNPSSTTRQSPPLPLQRLLRDLGPEATAPRSMSTLARTLAQFGRPSEAAVASALLFLATATPQDSNTDDSHTMFHLFALFCADPDNPTLDPAVQQAVAAANPSPLEWRPEVLVQAVTTVASQFNDPLDWRAVIHALDVEGLESRLSRQAFIKIANAYIAGSAGTHLPVDCLLDSWSHHNAQICMISHALACPDLTDWNVIDAYEGATAEDLASPFARVRLVERLVELDARDLLQMAIKDNADALLLSLTCSKPNANTNLQQKLTVTILTPIIAVFPTSSKTLRQLWTVAPALLEAGIISMWKKDPSMLRTALAISLDLQVLPDLLSTGTSLEFSLELAVLAFKQEMLELETWLGDLLSSRGLPAVSLCTLFMAQKVRSADPSPAAQLPLDAARIVFRCLVSALRNATGSQAQELMEGVRETLEAFRRINPRVADLNPEADVGDRSILVGSDVIPRPIAQPITQAITQSMALPSASAMLQSLTQSMPPVPQSLEQPAIPPISKPAAHQPIQSLAAVREVRNNALPEAASPTRGIPDGSAPGNGSNDSSLSDSASTAAAMFLPLSFNQDGTSTSFPGDVEKEADVFFGKLYVGEMPSEQAVDILRRLKSSNVEHELCVFNCTMHTLFDEYRFFKKYPDRELKITGMLFGSIIQVSLISGGVLGLAVRCVLDALRTIEPAPQPIGRLAKFGLCALERFRSRLHEWPQYCSRVLDIPRLKDLAPELIGEVRKAWERSSTTVPSAEETRLGIAEESDAPNEPIMSTDGVPPAASVPDPAESANNVTSLLASPTLSATHTPVRESFSSTSLRPSPSTHTVDGSTLGLSALNLTTLLGMTADEASQVIAPDENTQDKIKFIFNNLSTATMDDKVEEMLAILNPEWQRYFSIYIVVKRASSESNFHHLYLTMLDRIDTHMPTLYPLVYDTSYRRVRIVLSGDKSSTSSGRLVLKSLGSWIGSLTLARNKPILRRELDMKELLMDAYSHGRLTTVVPFVSKVLEACNRSKIFKTTNPWVRGILSLMKEIYSVPDLKLNMKFELQILCKGLDVDVNDVIPSDLLKSRSAPDKLHNPDFTQKKQPGSSPPRSSPSPSASPSPDIGRAAYAQQTTAARTAVPMFSFPETQSAAVSHTLPGQTGQVASSRVDINANIMNSTLSMGTTDPVTDLPNLLGNVSITGNLGTNQIQRTAMHAPNLSVPSAPGAPPTQRNPPIPPQESTTLVPNLSQYVQVSPSLDLFQSSPHLKRLIPIAIDRAIREIIQPVVERSCAIAFLTTKELTLKDFANEADLGKVRRAALQMVQQLAGSLALVTSKEPLRVSMGNQLRLLLGPSTTDQNLIDHTAHMVCTSNLEIGCAVIERHAKEKAARDLNEKIGPAFANRRPQLSSYSYGMAPSPEVLRVYDEFSRLHRAGATPPQYNGSQAVGAQAHAVHPAPVPSQSVPTTSMPVLSQPLQRPLHTLPDQRIVRPETNTNGTALESKPESRAAPVPVPLPIATPASTRGDPTAQPPVVTRRAPPVPPPVPEPPVLSSVYGTALPLMASPTSVAAALLAAAGSSNTSGAAAQLNSHGIGTGTGGGPSPGEEVLSTQQVLERFNSIYPQLTTLVADLVATPGSANVLLSDLPPDHEIHSLWIQIPSAVKRSVTADEAGMAVAQKVFKRLFEGESNLYREVHVLILEGIRESCRRLSKELSSWLAFSEERRKFHKECIVALIKPGSLLNITAYDEVLAKAMDSGRNTAALDFACFLIRRSVIDEPLATAAELYLTLEAMGKASRRSNVSNLPSCPEGLTALIEAARNVVHKPTNNNNGSANTSADTHSAPAKTPKDLEPTDPAGAREYVAGLLLEWQRIISSDSPERPVPEHVVASFLTQLRVGTLSNEDLRERFFRITVELVSTVTRAALQSRSGIAPVPGDLLDAPYTTVEGVVRLIGTMCRPDSNGNAEGNHSRGVSVLCQFLSALVKDILKNPEGSDLRPHFRMFSGLITELSLGISTRDARVGDISNAVKPKNLDHTFVNLLDGMKTKADAVQFLDDKNVGFSACVRNAGTSGRDKTINLDSVQTLTALVGALGCCSPLAVPGFVFSWLQLISNKELLPSLMYSVDGQGWPLFRHLIVRVLEFLSTFLGDSHVPLSRSVRVLYSGMLRVLLVLLHDFPEFLCAYHMSFCDVIPQNCVQLRNLVLASFPKDMRLPDPFIPELNVEELPEMGRSPLILSDFSTPLEANGVRATVDTFLRSGGHVDVEGLVNTTKLMNGEKHSAKQVGALVMYIGNMAIAKAGNGEGARMGGQATQLFRMLMRGLSAEGLHYVFNAIANQLRYPNNQTMYYSNLLLVLFHEAHEDSIKEQITRVLVERLIANRPHPWGLLITFVQLIKNSEYNFWGHGFVRCAPEIEQLFENVAKFCVGPVLHSKTNHNSVMAAS